MKLAIIGGGRHALESFYLLRDIGCDDKVIAFVQDEVEEGRQIMGIPIVAKSDFIRQHQGVEKPHLLGCIGSIIHSKRLVEWFKNEGFVFFNAISPTIKTDRQKSIGTGVTIAQGSVVTANVSIGNYSIINIGCTISHDVVIGDFVNISPGVHLAGHVHIDDEVFIGIGANVIPNIKVGKGAVIAAGACVIKDVPPYSLVAGVPATIKKHLR